MEKPVIPPHEGKIYHLIRPEDWEKAMEKGAFIPPSLQTEGFIHCSTREQVLGSANKHFTEGEELLVLQILSKRVKSILKWEVSRGGALFPHLYGPLEVEYVETLFALDRNRQGEWEWA